MQKILLLEDDRNLNRGISLKLEKEGYEVSSAFSVKEAEALFDVVKPDLVISDVNLPDKSGLDFCADIRKRSQVYLIFLTALDSEVDMVNAYDLGADDYITKPFSLMVLVSKVHAVMRRVRQENETPRNEICSGGLRISYPEMKAYREGETLSLSKVDREYVMDIVQKIGMEDRLQALPGTLSGGQQQRVAIARALASRPAIILADEPTGNLDSRTEIEVISLLKNCVAEYGQTLVMITHDETIAQMADRMIVIEDGKVVRS